MRHSPPNLPPEPAERPNRKSLDGGRPTHPAVAATEALMEALAAIMCEYERHEHTARALAALAHAEWDAARELRRRVYPEIHRGVAPAERLVAARVPA